MFPALARRMPEFQEGGGAAAAARGGPRGDGRPRGLPAAVPPRGGRLRAGTWGGVLWRHLDQEVEALRPENMRRCWSLEELDRIPM